MEIILALLITAGLGAFFSLGSDDDTSVDDTSDTPDEPDTPVKPDTPVEPDTAVGTDDDDVVSLSSSANVYDAMRGDDSVDGGAGFDVLLGGAGDDVLEGGLGKDVLYGEDGNDDMSGGSWNDTLYGGQGFDDLDGGTSNDTLFGGQGKDLLVGGTGNDVLDGDGWDDGLFGGDGDDTLLGYIGDDLLVGGDGDDELDGQDGEDILDGGPGADTLVGGSGDDTLIGSQLLNRELNEDDYEDIRNNTLPDNEDGEGVFNNWNLSGTDLDTESDTLVGGEGADVLLMGNNDIATGGDDWDDFVIGDWITDQQQVLITDFDTTEDLIIVFLQEDNLDAEITTMSVEGDEIIMIDGNAVAQVQGTFDPFDGLAGSILTYSYTGT
ncbi:calcium-binding protein [Octadecabacter sp. 1_MG-2023]|uniref:calcium-binding protein n=1 Tax=unclassified Octadecabacter TaxID=196158 RepID=UPI001C082768|nr:MULTISPECIES: calcium-binding protein [unclassified Octadecabacter]MBU2993448.1 hypothetical protein [Octadecabacter sp. B2R22]MDO6733096.1 calcium-binding protein [Octadecabacter sp. 1_MG-2023]